MAEVARLPGAASTAWEWQLHARCRGMDTEMFFHPEGERGPRRAAREAAAKAVCRTCPVAGECAAHALLTQEPYGVWGGVAEDERAARLAHRRRRLAS